jgi:predicted phosphodiesterase
MSLFSTSVPRRRLLQGLLAAGAVAPASALLAAEATKPALRGSFSVDDIHVGLHTSGVEKPVKLLMLADTHLSRDDERGAPYREFSARMAKAYNHTKHFRSKETTDPEQCFEQTLQAAQNSKVELLVLAGDIFSFPSEAAIEWVLSRLEKSGIPWLYTAGNHDWHYEGQPGTSTDLRRIWCKKRLSPLYQGGDPMMSAKQVGGVNVMLIDNSTYEIQAEQLAFFRQQAASGVPLVLFVHIPLYVPGRPVGFGCGHPQWGAAQDKNHLIERRPQWRAEGHSQVTLDFHREVFAASNLLGVFAGHTHQQTLDVWQGVPQMVVGANATGAHAVIEVLPPSAV